MVPGIAAEPCLTAFEGSVTDSLAFVREAQSLLEEDNLGRQVRLHIRRRELLAGLGLLKVQVAWEIFLEEAFTRYMCGAQSPSGYRPVLLSTKDATIEAARTRLLGSQRFLNWSALNAMSRASEHFDEGEPFSTSLSAVRHVLDEINDIRNRFAHSSQYAARQFNQVVRSHLGYMPRGMTVGRFLLTPISGLEGTGLRFIDLYGNLLLGAARAIVRR
jgi:hypothetical protein